MKNRNDPGISGVLILDKPYGMTSFAALQKVKRLGGWRKVGHGGTLDPCATGMLPLLLNNATKRAELFLNTSKEYQGWLQLGIKTDTQDITGIIQKSSLREARRVPLSRLEEEVRRLREIPTQRTPKFSAAKWRGKPLYVYARQGLPSLNKERKIKIFSFTIVQSKETEGRFKFILSCSKGTYVRQLIDDLGDRLTCGACLLSLRRTRLGQYDSDKMHSLQNIASAVQDPEKFQELLCLRD